MILLIFNRFHILVRILLLETSDDWSAVLYSNTSMLYQPIQDRGHIRDIQEEVSRSKPSKSMDGSPKIRSNYGSPIRLSYFPKKPLRLQPNPHGDLLCSTVSALDGVNHCCVGGFDGFGNFNFSHV